MNLPTIAAVVMALNGIIALVCRFQGDIANATYHMTWVVVLLIVFGLATERDQQ